MRKHFDAVQNALPRALPEPADTPAARRSPELLRAVNSDRHRFAAKVRAGRAVLGWSQTDLAQRTGLSQRSVYRLELAAVDVRRSTAVAIETVFADAGVAFEQHADGGFKIVVAGHPSACQ